MICPRCNTDQPILFKHYGNYKACESCLSPVEKKKIGLFGWEFGHIIVDWPMGCSPYYVERSGLSKFEATRRAKLADDSQIDTGTGIYSVYPVYRSRCILECDSPSFPAGADEYKQCGCQRCSGKART